MGVDRDGEVDGFEIYLHVDSTGLASGLILGWRDTEAERYIQNNS